MIEREEILKRIDKLQLLMLQVSPTLTCEWEVIAVEKIRDLFEKGILNGSAHMQFLNKIYNDYKFRKKIDDPTDIVILNHRKMDILFSEDKHDELMYKLRYEYLHSAKLDTVPDMNFADNDLFMVQQIKNDLKGLSVKFDYDIDIMRIRISKKPGDLVMVENPFDDKHSFPAVIKSSTMAGDWDKTKIDKVLRCEIKWYRQDDPSVTGSSTITDYDINTNGILFAEQVQNLT